MIFYDDSVDYSRMSKADIKREMKLHKWLLNFFKTRKKATEYFNGKAMERVADRCRYETLEDIKKAFRRGEIDGSEYKSQYRGYDRIQVEKQFCEDKIDWFDTMIKTEETVIWWLEDLLEDKAVEAPDLVIGRPQKKVTYRRRSLERINVDEPKERKRGRPAKRRKIHET